MSYDRPHKSRPGHPVIGGLQFLHPISTTGNVMPIAAMTSRIIGNLLGNKRLEVCSASEREFLSRCYLPIM